MAQRTAQTQAVRAWLAVPARIERAVQNLPERALDRRGGSEGWSIRETVHHLVEANLVASNIMLAALAKSGATYDWSWVMPDGVWMRRVGYTTAPVGPALSLLRALGEFFAAVLSSATGGLERHVRLLDAPGAATYKRTVKQILAQEVAHAGKHLRDIAATRAASAKRGPRRRR